MEIEDLLDRQDIPKDVMKAIQHKLENFREIEQKLKESEVLYRNVVERANDGIVIIQDSLIKYVNPSLVKITGFSADDLYKSPFINYIHPDFRSELINRYEKRMTGLDVPSIYETTLLLKNEKTLDVEINAGLITYQGKPANLAIIRDLTERRRADQALKESEEKYKILFDESPDGITIIGLDGIIQDCNKAASRISSVSKEEMIGKSYFDLEMLLEEDIPKYMDFFSKFLSGADIKPFESKIKRKDNKIRHFEVFPAFIKKNDEILAIQVISREITEHKQAEEELRKSKEKYQMLVEKLEEGVLLEDEKGYISFVNPKTAELLGYTKEELIGQHWRSIVPKEFLDKIAGETAKRPEGFGTTYEAGLLAKDGNCIPVIITATPIFSHKGEFEGVLSVFTDITDRKVVEQKLRESEERYRSYVENARDIIFSISSDGIITSLNPIMESITGWLQDEWIGKPFLPLVHEDDLPLILEGVQTILNREHFPSVETRLLKKSGDYVPVEIKASPQIQDGKVKGMLGIARNITKRKQAEEALRRVKLEEERYHAMMSHFVNNDMQKIINNLELVLLMYESNLELNRNIVNKVIAIASGSSKTIDMVNHIFEILQTPFIPKDGLKLVNVIKDVISVFSEYSHIINVETKNLDAMIFVDSHLKDVLNEVLLFILSSYDTRSFDATIDIKGSYLPSFYCISISDCCSDPLTQDVVSQLSGQITDEWEVIGHHIGIALASVIMHYYGGVLKIKSSDPKGNVFELRFPKELIEAKPIEIQE
ncbi:MAG: PAS domain S-box protein [Candidatus Hodarchaeota archaeon]